MGKATNHETAKRINSICTMLVRGNNNREIIHYASAQWGIGERQCQNLIARARKRIIEDMAIDRVEMLAMRLDTLNMVISRATKSEQWSNVIGAVKLQAEMIGLGQVSK